MLGKITIDLVFIAPSNICRIQRAIAQELGWCDLTDPEEAASERASMLLAAYEVLEAARIESIGDEWWDGPPPDHVSKRLTARALDA